MQNFCVASLCFPTNDDRLWTVKQRFSTLDGMRHGLWKKSLPLPDVPFPRKQAPLFMLVHKVQCGRNVVFLSVALPVKPPPLHPPSFRCLHGRFQLFRCSVRRRQSHAYSTVPHHLSDQAFKPTSRCEALEH